MFSNIKRVKPRNPDYYSSRCGALQRNLALNAPPIMVVSACWDVMKEAFGGKYQAARWVLIGMAYDLWEDIFYLTQYNWHVYVRLRTQEETGERVFRTLVDVKTISGFKDDAEFEEWLSKMLSEDEGGVDG